MVIPAIRVNFGKSARSTKMLVVRVTPQYTWTSFGNRLYLLTVAHGCSAVHRRQVFVFVPDEFRFVVKRRRTVARFACTRVESDSVGPVAVVEHQVEPAILRQCRALPVFISEECVWSWPWITGESKSSISLEFFFYEFEHGLTCGNCYCPRS